MNNDAHPTKTSPSLTAARSHQTKLIMSKKLGNLLNLPHKAAWHLLYFFSQSGVSCITKPLGFCTLR
jgi:hypothetical protein